MLDKVGESDLTVTEKNESDQDRQALSTDVQSAPEKPRGNGFWSFIGKSGLVILQAVLMIAILYGSFVTAKRMIDDKPDPRKRRAFKTVYTIETITAELKNHRPVFTSYGQTVAARSVDLRSLVSGEIIRVNPNLRAGARVSKGEELLEIDRFNYSGALAEAEANLLEAKARVVESEAQASLEVSKLSATEEQLKFAVDDLERVERLKARRTATQKQVDERRLVVSQRRQAVALSRDTIKVQESRVNQQKASIDRLQWRVDQAKRNLESTILTAPFSGIVLSSTAELGRALTANDAVVSLYDADALEVKFTLTDAQYGRLQTAQDGLLDRNVEIAWTVGDKEWVYPARIDRVGAEITSNRGGVEVFAVVGKADNPVSMRPGAFVEVRVPDRSFENAIIVPDTAIYGTDTIYVAVDGKLEERKVEIAAFEGETAVVTSGLKGGDEVLTTRITEVSAGLNVRREGDPEPARGNRPTPSANNATGGSGAPQGRPSREEIAKILEANKLTMAEFRAMEQEKRRALIRTYRSSAN